MRRRGLVGVSETEVVAPTQSTRDDAATHAHRALIRGGKLLINTPLHLLGRLRHMFLLVQHNYSKVMYRRVRAQSVSTPLSTLS